jgi:hypothetical protein
MVTDEGGQIHHDLIASGLLDNVTRPPNFAATLG